MAIRYAEDKPKYCYMSRCGLSTIYKLSTSSGDFQ